MKDWVLGEEVNYSYDSLARLSAAWTTEPEWGQAYSYDGWGNLTGKSVTKGSAPTFSAAYDGATNRQVGLSYDANGNVYPIGSSYDAENRMMGYGQGPTRTFKYDAFNRRVMVQEYSGPEDELSAEEVTFYGPGGERMGVYRRSIWHDPYSIGGFGGQQAQVWFGGKLIQASGQRVVQDRLGTVTVQGTERMRYWPYGEERGTATQKRQKWATYWRDEIGVDYAMARYQEKGRFLSPDPSGAADPTDPGSWNMYAYAGGDPINFNDPDGLEPCGSLLGWGTGGKTLKDLILADDDAGLLGRLVWAEGTGSVSPYYILEKTAIAVSVVNRWKIDNGLLFVLDANGNYLRKDFGGTTYKSIIGAAGQYDAFTKGAIPNLRRASRVL